MKLTRERIAKLRNINWPRDFTASDRLAWAERTIVEILDHIAATLEEGEQAVPAEWGSGFAATGAGVPPMSKPTSILSQADVDKVLAPLNKPQVQDWMREAAREIWDKHGPDGIAQTETMLQSSVAIIARHAPK